jgi:hypothetical protein
LQYSSQLPIQRRKRKEEVKYNKMSADNNNDIISNRNNQVNPYNNRDSAILWLRSKGIEITDDSHVYHSMAFRFPTGMSTGKEIDTISQLGRIALIDFANRTVHVFTATDNIMEK